MNNPHFRMPKVQILVADASRARVFTVESPKGELQELQTFVNPEGRLHARDLTTDRAGRQQTPMADSRSAMDETTEPKDVEAQRFARELAQSLEAERSKGNLEKLYLVAPPRFLGELRKHLSRDVSALIAGEIDKDLTYKDATKLRGHLPELLK